MPACPNIDCVDGIDISIMQECEDCEGEGWIEDEDWENGNGCIWCEQVRHKDSLHQLEDKSWVCDECFEVYKEW